MSSGLYNHTTRAVGTVLTAAIYNADHINHITNANPIMFGALSDTVSQMQSQRDPGDIGSEVLAANLEEEIEALRYAIARLAGVTHWYEVPVIFGVGGVKNSIEMDSDELQLVGDEPDPGNNFFYGTDSDGDRGWYDFVGFLDSLPKNLIVENYTDNSAITAADVDHLHIMTASAEKTTTLPALSGLTAGDRMYFYNAGTANWILDAAGADLIDRAAGSYVAPKESGILVVTAAGYIWLKRPRMVLHVRDQRAANSGSLTPVAEDTWHKRDINTVIANSIFGVNVDGTNEQITLPIGRYKARIWTMLVGDGVGNFQQEHRARLWNASNSEAIAYSRNCNNGGNAHQQSAWCHIDTEFEITAVKVLEIFHRVQGSGNSAYVPMNLDGTPEVYLDAIFEKVG